MKRVSLLAIFLALAVLLAFPVTGLAGSGPAPKATGDCTSEVLTGDLIGIRTLVFNAQGTLTEAKGHVYFSLAWPPTGFFRYFEGEVTGYWQDGNRAAFRGVITAQAGYNPSDPPTHFVIRVEDNGQGANAEPDRFMAFHGLQLADDLFLTDWENDVPGGHYPFSTYSVPLASGNIVVH